MRRALWLRARDEGEDVSPPPPTPKGQRPLWWMRESPEFDDLDDDRDDAAAEGSKS